MALAIPNDTNVIDLTASTPELSDKDTPSQTDRRHKSVRKGQNSEAVEPSELPKGHSRECAPSEQRKYHEEQNGVEFEVNGDTRRQKRRRDEHSSHQEDSPERPHLTAPPLSDVFFIDVKPNLGAEGVSGTANKNETPKLLLPAHVSVFGGDGRAIPIDILSPMHSDAEDDDYIEYLDYDDRKADLPRYYEEEIPEYKQTRRVCKNCGAEGEHKTHECPVEICLTCGARDEHLTRSCPISKTCFNCGMKGHINRTCPNRHSRDAVYVDDECDRCGSDIHKTNECPTWWRLYEYLPDSEREKTLQQRRDRSIMRIGFGGEGYIAEDDWCHSCGDCGHLGDDCSASPITERPREPSAFSAQNVMSGPFFDPAADQRPSTFRHPRKWEKDTLPDGWGKDAPVNVGKQGRTKNKVKMEQMQRTAEEHSDDWFENPRNARTRGVPTGPASNRFGRGGIEPPRKKMPISFSAKQFQSSSYIPSPRLLDRMGDDLDRGRYQAPSIRGASKNRQKSDYGSGAYRRNDRERDDGGGKEQDRISQAGPRYKGGYVR